MRSLVGATSLGSPEFHRAIVTKEADDDRSEDEDDGEDDEPTNDKND